MRRAGVVAPYGEVPGAAYEVAAAWHLRKLCTKALRPRKRAEISITVCVLGVSYDAVSAQADTALYAEPLSAKGAKTL